MTKSSEIMARLDAVDVDEMLNGKAGYAFLTLDELVDAILGDEERGCTSFQQTFRDVREALREAFEELEERAMPEGYEWTRYEDGEPVRIGGSILTSDGAVTCEKFSLTICDSDGGVTTIPFGQRVKRPKAIAADGEPLEVGQTVYSIHYGCVKCTVLSIEWSVDDYLVLVEIENEGGHRFRQTPDEFTHQRPMLDADGVPIHEGDTVYLLPGEWCDRYPCIRFRGGEELNVIDLNPKPGVSGSIKCYRAGKLTGVCYPQPSQLTHTKPDADSWERVEEDKGLNPFDYCKKVGHKLWTFDNVEEFKASDLVRRCKALAERGE